MLKRFLRHCTMAILCLTWVAGAHAVEISRLDDGTPYIVGGVTKDERTEIETLKPMFNLWVQTATLPSGSYLSDVKVSVVNAQGKVLFDQTLDGPWMMVKLPVGRYRINATYEAKTLHRDVKVAAEKMEPVYFHFDMP